jgi:nitronate monooxygenase
MMGTRFIATPESMAKDGHKAMLVDSRLDDVMTTQALTGLDANMLRPSIVAAGLDPKAMLGQVTPERARELFSEHGKEATGPKRWVDIWSAGHSVSGVGSVQPVAELVEELAQEYEAARAQSAQLA